jgi:hypothetical protein
MSDMSRAAAWYAQNGFPVFPLRARTKKPLTEHGCLDATVDAERIAEWWKEHPESNIGLAMGAGSRLLLVDLDYRNGSVVEDRADLIRRYGPIPDTAEVISGSGGRHIYFRDPGCRVPKQIAKGIELKGQGGYSVAPPSIHPNGNEYVFDGITGAKALLSVANPPQWLLDAIRNGRSPKKQHAGEKRWPQGERNTGLASLAGKLRYAGISPDSIEAALLRENQLHCDPPLSDAEVKKIARSVGRYEPGPSHPRYAEVNVDAAPSIELLNSLAIFENRLRFLSLHRRGQMIVATFAGGGEAIWPSASDLMSFARSQAILADALDVVISSPSRSTVRRKWEPAAQLILQLAVGDKVTTDAALREEFREILRGTWERAGSPIADTPEKFVALLQQCNLHCRNPQEGPPCCCIWIAEGAAWTHQPQLTDFLSTPGGKNKHYPWEIVRSALLLLEFQPVRSLTRSAGGTTAKANVWKGPMALLLD